MTISISLNGQYCQQVIYNKEDAFEKFIVDNAETIFGANSIYVDMKHRIENSSLGGTIPDGVLIDLSDLENPKFYIVEVELQNHDFRTHIYPQIDKFFDFYSNIQERNKLTEKIYSTFRQDDPLHSKLKNIIGSKEIYRFLKGTLENSQNILIIIDGPKPEIEEKMKSRLETWGKWVNVQIVNHFKYENQNIIITEPPSQKIESFSKSKGQDKDRFGNHIGTNRCKIDSCLSEKPKKMRQLVKEAGVSTTYYNFLNNMVKMGLVIKDKNGYRLPESGCK